eukprot:gene28942-34931_t
MNTFNQGVHTLNFLQSISCDGSTSFLEKNITRQEIFSKLVGALQFDGYDVVRSHEEHLEIPFLRRLSEGSSGGGDFVVNFLLVVVCVTMAGFASGLTQDFKTWLT